MSPDNELEVRILGFTDSGHVEYTSAGQNAVSTTVDFIAWLLQMQDSGMEIILKERAKNGLYVGAQAFGRILCSSGATRFLREADRLEVKYALTPVRQGANAATMAYALPELREEGGARGVLYFLLFSQPNGEHVQKDILREVTGVTNSDRARKKALRLLGDEMEAPAFAPFVSQEFRTLTRIVFDESSLERPERHDFSTGIRLDKGGGYVHITLRDAYRVLSGLHGSNVSAARLL